MKLLASQIDEASLSQLGEEAVSLLEKRDFRSLADRFGYALAFDKDPATAIEEDLQSCINEFQTLPDPQNPAPPSIVVKYFKQNDSALFALVECVFTTSKGCPILAELIVTSKGEVKYATLEQVSLTAA